MTQSNELLPCPFCGEVPERDSSEDENYDVTLWVKCISQNCEVHPALFWYEDDRVGNGRFFHPDDMYNAWNTRSTPPQSPKRAVLDAFKAVKSQAELLYGEDAKFNLFYIYAEMGLSAANQAMLDVLPWQITRSISGCDRIMEQPQPRSPMVIKDSHEAVLYQSLDQAKAFAKEIQGMLNQLAAATQADEVNVIDGLETAFECDTEEKRWAFHDMYNKFPEAVINEAAHEHLKCQKGR